MIEPAVAMSSSVYLRGGAHATNGNFSSRLTLCEITLRALFIFVLMLSALSADARIYRSHQAIAEFKRLEPCPSTGWPRGRCPGYVIDHVVPLCAGGPDVAANMQWQTVADAKLKDRAEWAQCRRLP